MYLTLHQILQEKKQRVSAFSDERFGAHKDHLALQDALEEPASASLFVLTPAILSFLWPCWTICVSLNTAGGRLPSSLHLGCSFDLPTSTHHIPILYTNIYSLSPRLKSFSVPPLCSHNIRCKQLIYHLLCYSSLVICFPNLLVSSLG